MYYIYAVLPFFTSGGGVNVVLVKLSLIEHYQGCQFDEHFIQCQISTDILEIVNEFVQCDQNYFQYMYIPN